MQYTVDELQGIVQGVSSPHDVPMPTPVAPTQEVQAKPTYGQSAVAAFKKSNPVYNVLKYFTEDNAVYAPDDEDYTQYPELFVMEDGSPMPEQAVNKVMGQASLIDARRVSDDFKERSAYEKIQYANGTGIGVVTELAAWLDPVSVMSGEGLIGVTAGIAKAIKAGSTAKRIIGGVTVGGIAGGEQALSNLGREEASNEGDVLMASLIGGGAGAALGKMMYRLDDVDDILAHTHARTETLASEVGEGMRAKKVVQGGTSDEPLHVPDGIEDVTGRGLIQETDEAVEGVMASKQSTREREIAAGATELAKKGGVIQLDKGKVKAMLDKNPFLTDGYRAITSKSNTAKVIATHFGELAVGQRGNAATTSTMYKLMHESVYLKMIPVMETARGKFLNARGVRQWNVLKYNGTGRKMFDEELMAEMGRRYIGRAADDIDPHIKQAADAIDQATKKALDDLARAGWEGADSITWKAGYVPLIWSGAKMMSIVNKGGRQGIKDLLTQAYRSVDMSPELADRLAEAIIHRKLAGAADLDFNPAALFSKSSRGELERMLTEAGVSDVHKHSILKLTEAQPKGMKARTSIDLSTTVGTMRVMDIIETDVGNIMSRWAQEAGGKVGLAKKGVRSLDDVEAYKTLVRKEAADAGEDATKLGASVDAIFDTLLARPVNGGVSRNVRRALDITKVSKLGQVGFAQVAEMNNITAAHGVFQTLRAVPQAKRMYSLLKKAAKTGEFDKAELGWLGELQALGGQMFDEHLLLRPGVRLDEKLDNGWKGVFDNVMAVAEDKLGYLSGMYQVKGLEQTLALVLQGDKVARLLKGTPRKGALKRAAELGWGDETIARVTKALNEHATFQGKALDRLNLEKWDELTRVEYIQGMHRHVNQMIQRGFAGEGAYWMHNDVAAMFTQFRSFPLLAIEKQTGRHLMAGDAETGAAFLYGAGWATVASLSKTYTNSIGMSKEKKKKYLTKRLSPEALATQAMNYNSTASIFGDVAGAFGGFLGLSSSAARGGGLVPPVISSLQQAWTGASGLAKAATPWGDASLKAHDIRSTITAMPWGNTIHATLISNQLQKLGK